MEFTIGVLTIGSLYWDECAIRKTWRESRLKWDEQFAVEAPIRYGRKSSSRGNTYTMVFSRSCVQRSDKIGQAKAIRCKHLVSSIDDLVCEAEQFWAAECLISTPSIKLSAEWGCVALLANPKSNVSRQLLDDWVSRVSKEGNYGKLQHTAEEGCVVSDDGFLQIDWPKLFNSNSGLPWDLLLATATDPTLEGNPPDYPSAEEIAAAWKNDSKGNVEYFWHNKKSGIHTSDDTALIRSLET